MPRRRLRSPAQQAATPRMLAANRQRRARVSRQRRPPRRTQPQVRARGYQPSSRILATLRTLRRRIAPIRQVPPRQPAPMMMGSWSGRPVSW